MDKRLEYEISTAATEIAATATRGSVNFGVPKTRGVVAVVGKAARKIKCALGSLKEGWDASNLRAYQIERELELAKERIRSYHSVRPYDFSDPFGIWFGRHRIF